MNHITDCGAALTAYGKLRNTDILEEKRLAHQTIPAQILRTRYLGGGDDLGVFPGNYN